MCGARERAAISTRLFVVGSMYTGTWSWRQYWPSVHSICHGINRKRKPRRTAARGPTARARTCVGGAGSSRRRPAPSVRLPMMRIRYISEHRERRDESRTPRIVPNIPILIHTEIRPCLLLSPGFSSGGGAPHSYEQQWTRVRYTHVKQLASYSKCPGPSSAVSPLLSL